MGAFVLGVLFGWLLEWLFFTYWIKGRSTGRFADCSGVESDLSEKNREISALKAELEEVKNASKAVAAKASNSSASATAKKSDSQTVEKPASDTKPSKSKAKPKPAASTAKKPAPKKATATKKSTKKPTAKKAKPTNGDDFTKLSGIGPSISAKLNELGISTFQKLSEMDDDILRDMLEEAGAKLNNNKEAMDSWNEQAALAAKDDFDGLKKLQESLKS